MIRLPDWLQQLHAYIESVRRQRMHPVSHNCALFAAGAVAAMTGESPGSRLGIAVTSERDVARVLATFGGVAGLAARYFETPMLPALTARRGDVMIKPCADGDTLGICMGDHALFLGADGLHSRAIGECTGCWHVPWQGASERLGRAA